MLVLAAAATSKAALREVELREKQLIEAKDEVVHEKRTLKLEREELSRLKASVRREEDDIKVSDFENCQNLNLTDRNATRTLSRTLPKAEPH